MSRGWPPWEWVVWPAVFAAIIAVQVGLDPECLSDQPPTVQDAAEVYDIACSLAAGRGFAFDWDAPAFRDAWASRNRDGALDEELAHHGGPYPTLSRPPLLPAVLAVVLRVAPAHPFRAWRLTDLALFAAATTALGRAVGRRFGWRAAVALVAVATFDPVRGVFIPGLWTEGLAFDGVAVAAALVLSAPPRSVAWVVAGGGLVLGWLCLDRSVFLLWVAVWPIVLAAAVGGPCRRRVGVALAVAAVGVAVQVPWWARNAAVAGGRFVPLGTQGGTNLPEEYGDWAVHCRGLWHEGLGMARLWRDRESPPAAVPAAAVGLMPRDPLYAALLYAETCRSTASELAVSDLGRRATAAWIRSHPGRLPWLFGIKLADEVYAHQRWTAFLLAAAAAGVWLAPAGGRRPLWLLLALAATHAAGIGLTHSVLGRFLVPGLPALHVPAAVALAEVVRRATGSPPSRA